MDSFCSQALYRGGNFKAQQVAFYEVYNPLFGSNI